MSVTESVLKRHSERLQDGDWGTEADSVSSVNQGPSEKLEPHLMEVKHKGESKL
jgi:hypothetical protein